MKIKILILFVPLISIACATMPPDPNLPDADVLFVKAIRDSNTETWTFEVTVQHPDTGWEDYVNGWDIVTPEGEVLKRDTNDAFTRTLLHPHVNGQPFTRSQSGILIPEDIDRVVVRAHDLLGGFGGAEIWVDLNQSSGPGFEVHR